MDFKLKEQLGEFKHVDSVNQDIFTKIFLNRDVKKLTEEDITHFLNASEQFDLERQQSNKYYLYGGIELFSILNGITTNYNSFEDFFKKEDENKKSIYNTFDFYLLKPLSYESEEDNYELLYDNYYVRKFEVIGINSDFIIDKQAFAKNIFNDEKYNYLINKDIILDNNLDWFGKPITELYIMPMYKKSYTGQGDEEIFVQNFTYSGGTINVDYDNISGNTIQYEMGDIVYGDVVIWNKETYNETVYIEKELKITTPYEESDGVFINEEILVWKYKPLLPIKIDYLTNETSIENISGTTYVEIPEHAIKLDDYGNYIWKDVLDKGFIDNLYNIGTDYPFVNGKHYIHSNYIIKLIPDISDPYTKSKFDSIIIDGYNTLDNNTNIDNYGDLC